jgi:sporulation protein YlmC with PRC-barrel domain
MPAYDSEAMLIGTVLELGLRKASNGKMDLSMKIRTDNDLSNRSTEVLWENISKIGDVVLLSMKPSSVNDILPKCSSCGHENEEAAIFCEECGKKLI